jgi:LCP family protein required for cell wall assembly
VALIVLDVALLGWRAIAIVQAYAARGVSGRRSAPTYITAGLVVIAIVMHAVPVLYAAKAIDTLNAVALGGDGGGFGARPAPGFGEREEPLPPPSDEPETAVGERVTFLLVGVDSGFERDWALTDTMLVVSVDPDGTSAMISVPRDLYGVRLPDGRTYDDKLNSLLSVADGNPDQFPSGGANTLKETIGDLLGIRIHYFAALNLIGFKQAIDAIGGVDITVQRAIADPVYSEDGIQGPGFYLDAGQYHMDGSLALAYVRSRHGPGDSDFTRAERQQEVLAAVQEKLTAGNLLVGLPGLLDAVRNTIATDVPSLRIPQLAEAVQAADMSRLQRVVIQPPLVTPEEIPVAGYVLHPDLVAIRALVADIVADADERSSAAPPGLTEEQ